MTTAARFTTEATGRRPLLPRPPVPLLGDERLIAVELLTTPRTAAIVAVRRA
jgi:hypothetical protein